MYNANAQNSIIRVRTELNDCSYDPSMKDYLANLIVSTMNFPKKNSQVRHFIKNMGQNKIVMIWYPMSIPFAGKNYNVPLQIYIMRNVPYEPPQIFLEVVQGSAANPSNKDIDPNNNRIMTNSLRNWNQYSTMDSVMNEIYNSFSRVFPIYKKTSNNPQPQQPQQPQYQQGVSGGGGIYGMLVNEVKNMYNQNLSNQNNNNKGVFAFQPPKQSIYGQAMSSGVNNNYNNNNNNYNNNNYNNNYNNNNYNNNNYNNNNQQPQSFGGGIYGNNSNNNNNNIYNNNNNYNNNYNNNNQQQPQSFSGGIYGNNNNNNNNNNYNNYNNQQQQPKSFGGGIYGDNNNNSNYNNNNQQQQPNSYGGGIYGNNQNQFSGGVGVYGQQNQNPDEDFKNILVEEVSSKISNKLIEEKKRLKTQNDKMKNYKTTFTQENQKLQNFVNNQNLIKTRCDEDMNNMANALNKINDQINQGKNMTLNEENCLKLVEVPDPNPLKIIASEATIEEMILVVRKGFERKKISFDEAIMFMRNSSRDLFAVKFLKEKAINKYKY